MRLLLIALTFIMFSNISYAEDFIVDCEHVNPEDIVTHLACNIYHEARDQSELGQFMVARTTIDRLKSDKFPNNIHDVIWQRKWSKKYKRWVAQFTWTYNGLSDRVYERDAWERAVSIAELMLEAHTSPYFTIDLGVPSESMITHYHSTEVNPRWNKNMIKVAEIGDHIFYVEN